MNFDVRMARSEIGSSMGEGGGVRWPSAALHTFYDVACHRL